MFEGGRARLGTGENGLGGSNRKKKNKKLPAFLTSNQMWSGRGGSFLQSCLSDDKHSEVSTWGAASCVPDSLRSKNALCFTRVQRKSGTLLKASPHFTKSLNSPFFSERGGQALWAAENPKSSPGQLIPVGVGLEFAVITPLVR